MMLNEEQIWEKIYNEYESSNRRKGLWAKLFAELEGDEAKVKVQYLKTRVAQLEVEQEIELQKIHSEIRKAEEIKLAQVKLDEERERSREIEISKKMSIEMCLDNKLYKLTKHRGFEYYIFPNGQAALKRLNEYRVYENVEMIKDALDHYFGTELLPKKGFLRSIKA